MMSRNVHKDVKVGDVMVTETHQRWTRYSKKKIVTVTKVTPNGTVTVDDGLGKGIKVFTPTGKLKGGCGYSTYLKSLPEGMTPEKMVEKIAAEIAEMEAEKEAKQNEASAKAHAHREKIEAYWIYKGKELWEGAKEANTVTGTVKVVSFTDRYNALKTAFVAVYHEEDMFATAKAQRNNEKAEKVMQLKASICGVTRVEGGRGPYPQTWSTSITAKDEHELIYDIVH